MRLGVQSFPNSIQTATWLSDSQLSGSNLRWWRWCEQLCNQHSAHAVEGWRTRPGLDKLGAGDKSSPLCRKAPNAELSKIWVSFVDYFKKKCTLQSKGSNPWFPSRGIVHYSDAEIWTNIVTTKGFFCILLHFHNHERLCGCIRVQNIQNPAQIFVRIVSMCCAQLASHLVLPIGSLGPHHLVWPLGNQIRALMVRNSFVALASFHREGFTGTWIGGQVRCCRYRSR
jgi:hypothetical protein